METHNKGLHRTTITLRSIAAGELETEHVRPGGFVKKSIKLLVFGTGGVLLGALIGYLGQCAGGT
ncbi:MAG: hypothetical protein IH613_16260 [Desulfuromonadales bacterium]|nr:hypothetical protein [Desulfuromonadales bacterium]